MLNSTDVHWDSCLVIVTGEYRKVRGQTLWTYQQDQMFLTRLHHQQLHPSHLKLRRSRGQLQRAMVLQYWNTGLNGNRETLTLLQYVKSVEQFQSGTVFMNSLCS